MRRESWLRSMAASEDGIPLHPGVHSTAIRVSVCLSPRCSRCRDRIDRRVTATVFKRAARKRGSQQPGSQRPLTLMETGIAARVFCALVIFLLFTVAMREGRASSISRLLEPNVICFLSFSIHYFFPFPEIRTLYEIELYTLKL